MAQAKAPGHRAVSEPFVEVNPRQLPLPESNIQEVRVLMAV
jgi:hypothetical protein